MKKVMIFLIAIGLCFGMVACGGNKDQGNQEPTTQPPTAASTENPLGFDPNNPEGWFLDTEEDWGKWSDWMKSKGLPIAEKDYSIGDFTLLMTLEDAKKQFPSKPLSETEEDQEVLIEKKTTFDSLVLIFVQLDNEPPFDLYSIEVTGKKYITPRGLRVGDSAEKLFTLYGIPSSVRNNEWAFMDNEGNYELFYATVVNGIVKKVVLTSIM